MIKCAWLFLSVSYTSLLPLYMQYYKEGVFSSSRCSSNELNHAMVITGYGTYNGVDYYLVKNRYFSHTAYIFIVCTREK